jgi:hypothetical protein
MSTIEPTKEDLESAVEAARSVSAMVPPVKRVGFLRTVPGSTMAAREVLLNASIAAWQIAAIIHIRLEQKRDSKDCRINWANSVKAAQAEKSLQHLEAMTQHTQWMSYDLSQDAIDAMDGDK